MKEVEAKTRITNLEGMAERLSANGWVMSEPVSQDDRIFLLNGIDYAHIPKGTVFLRIRSQNGKTIFTYKQAKTNELDCIERELEISDASAQKDILEFLGFYEVMRLNKLRQKGKKDGMTICLDEVEGLGSFLEVEKMVEESADSSAIQSELFGLLQTLGAKTEDRIEVGYDTLMYQKNKTK